MNNTPASPAAKLKTEGALDGASCSPSASAMPLDAALEFAGSEKSTGGIMTHEALKTLAGAIRGCAKERDEAKSTLVSALMLLADIREAVGDPTGKLMQDELVERCRELRKSRHSSFDS